VLLLYYLLCFFFLVIYAFGCKQYNKSQPYKCDLIIMESFYYLIIRKNVCQDDVANFNWLQKVMEYKSTFFYSGKKKT
jgi:hypothetical protein